MEGTDEGEGRRGGWYRWDFGKKRGLCIKRGTFHNKGGGENRVEINLSLSLSLSLSPVPFSFPVSVY